MTDQPTSFDPPDSGDLTAPPKSRISPLPGEPGIPSVASPAHSALSIRRVATAASVTACLIAASWYSLHRTPSGGKDSAGPEFKHASDRPTAATTGVRQLDMTPPPTVPSRPAGSGLNPRLPIVAPPVDMPAEPIGVRRTEDAFATAGAARPSLPQDAPVMLIATRPGSELRSKALRRQDLASAGPDSDVDSATNPNDTGANATTRNLQGYQRQLQGLLDNLTRNPPSAAGPSRQALTGATGATDGTGNGLFDGQLKGSATPRVSAALLGHRSLTLPKGTAFTCALKTKVISANSGLVGCQVQRNVYGEDGRVLLIERGSHMDGEYRSAAIRPGTVRIPVLWTRIRTPNGVTVDIDSPASGLLGESGVDGNVDNRWVERIGAAMLLSLIDDSVKLVIQDHADQTGSTGQSNTFVLPSTTSSSSKLAEKVLDSTVNIPPLIYQNQGGIVGIYVARDVDFSSVYELLPTAMAERE